MGRVAIVPEQLKRGPFTLEDARRAGLSRWHLEGSSWRRAGPRTYVWAGLGDSDLLQLTAARMRLPREAVFSGLTAAWLHGLDVAPCDPINVTLPPDAGVSGRSGLRVHRASLHRGEVTSARGFRATTIERTLADVCGSLTMTELVVLADAATHSRLTSINKLMATAHRSAGRAGVAQLRRAIELAEPATESPMETRLRMVLVLAGVPRPLVQIELRDRHGGFLGRPDLYYPDQRLGLEYDGTTHRTSLVDDNRRQNRLLAQGIRLLRFTASDIYNRPEAIVAEVRVTLQRTAA